MDFHLLIKVNAANVAQVMAALAPFGGVDPAPAYQAQPPAAPAPSYPPQTGTAPPPMQPPQGAPAYNPPPPPPQAQPQQPQPGATNAQSVYPAMQAYAAQYRADGVGRVFARYGVNPPGLHTCTPEQLAMVKQHFESMQPA